MEEKGKARQVTSWTALLCAALLAVYAAALGIGLATLPTPESPITDPWFTIMEGLILFLVPVLIALAAGLHLAADHAYRPLSLTGLGLMIAMGTITALVHFSVLILSRHPDFPAAPQVLAFQWPSVAYVLDILAWDGFFALSVLCLAASITGGGANAVARTLLIITGLLSLVGLAGVPLNNMAIRNIGILGYVGVFIPACIALHIAYRRPTP